MAHTEANQVSPLLNDGQPSQPTQVSGPVGPSRKSLLMTHYHYTTWPDHGTPEDSVSIRRMCNELRSLRVQVWIDVDWYA